MVVTWKKSGRLEDRSEANNIRKQLKHYVNSNRRNKVRRHIKIGNLKTLWDAVKIAKDENTCAIPRRMRDGDETIDEERLQEAFAEHFSNNVENIVKETAMDNVVYN
jgi:hypothetical protein